MSDTGAPWNLPYPLPTDLVRDGADAIKDLAEAVAAGLDEAGNPGIGSNVVSVTKTNVFSTSANGNTNVTDLSVTITPTSATARLFVMTHVLFATETGAGTNAGGLRLSDGTNSSPVATDVGSRNAFTVGYNRGVDGYVSFSWLYVPGVTTPVTINLQIMRTTTAGNSHINRFLTDTNDGTAARPTSMLSVIEVAA
jgi:hypothetical protein